MATAGRCQCEGICQRFGLEDSRFERHQGWTGRWSIHRIDRRNRHPTESMARADAGFSGKCW